MSQSSLSDVRVVLFDLDGTLLDSAPDLAAAANVLRQARGLEDLPLEHYRPYVGSGARGMLRIALDMQQDHTDFDAYKEKFFSAYESVMMCHAELFGGVEELLRALDAHGIAWGVVTNKSKRFAQPIVMEHPVLGRAKVLVCGDTTPYAKPHPEPLRYACSVLGVLPANTIYVGDDERDIQAANAAEMRSVAAEYGYLGGFESAAQWGANAVIKSPVGLLKLLTLD